MSVISSALLMMIFLFVTQGAPFLMLRERKDGEPAPQGNNRYEGFSIELANYLAKEVNNFQYEFRIVADNAYGAKLSNNSWNGMIGELIDGVADLAVAPLTITAERERYVDFSKPFMEIGVTIVIKKPQSQRPGVFSFMEPLSVEVWVCIIVAYLTVSIGLFLVSRFSPVEWKKVRENQVNIDWSKVREEKDGIYHNDFSLFNSFWFSMGALMFQGSDTCPRSISGRIIGGAWWFFVLIIISSYTANLAAFLTIERMVSPIESADDLAKHPTIKYGAVASGATLQFFLNSEVEVYRQMGEYMKTHSEVLVQSNEEGIERVLKSKGKYAFLAESSFVDYINERTPCETVSVGGKLNNIGFGVATPRNSPLRSCRMDDDDVDYDDDVDDDDEDDFDVDDVDDVDDDEEEDDDVDDVDDVDDDDYVDVGVDDVDDDDEEDDVDVDDDVDDDDDYVDVDVDDVDDDEEEDDVDVDDDDVDDDYVDDDEKDDDDDVDVDDDDVDDDDVDDDDDDVDDDNVSGTPSMWPC
ncbi:Glutamate receptor 1 [Bulinus truncatus]|nr:Glutamate receptor 1 [Bulinus truncatus]